MEQEIIRKGYKNTVFVAISQAVSLCLGIAKSLILPVLLGVSGFGYWQVYLLYVSYVGIFALGFNDGIYLRYGKYEYKDLPKPVFRSSIRIFIIFQLVMMVVVSLFVLFEPDAQKQVAMLLASINIPIAGLTGVLIYVLQVTNQFKKYSFFTVLDKTIVLFIILIAFVLKHDSYMLIIGADLFTKATILVLLIVSCRGLILGKAADLHEGVREIFSDVNVGIKLMLANLTGMLVLGFGRFIVERFEKVEVYGTYAFAISTINMVLVFITAIGLVLYPTLSRIDKSRYGVFFVEINNILGVLSFVSLLGYFPLKLLIENYMQEYTPIFSYLPIIFALIIIQTKMQILINPFYKLLREERSMLFANLSGMLIAIALVLPMYFLTESVTMVALATFLAMIIRAYLSQHFLEKKLSRISLSVYFMEFSGLGLFLLFAYQNTLWIGFSGYFVVASLMVFIQRRIVQKLIRNLLKR